MANGFAIRRIKNRTGENRGNRAQQHLYSLSFLLFNSIAAVMESCEFNGFEYRLIGDQKQMSVHIERRERLEFTRKLLKQLVVALGRSHTPLKRGVNVRLLLAMILFAALTTRAAEPTAEQIEFF